MQTPSQALTDPPPPHHDGSAARWSPVLVGLFSLALGLVGLGAKSLWFDEAYDAVHAAEGWNDVLSTAFGHEASQALYLVFLKSWFVAVPNEEWWARLPSAIFAALAAATLVVLGARLFGRRAGIFAGVLLALNAFVVVWSQQARTYSFVMLAVIVSTYMFVRALGPQAGTGSWVAYGIVAAVSVYAHFFAGFVIAAHAVAAAFARPRIPVRNLMIAALLVVGGAAPALWFAATQDVGQISFIAPLSIGGVKGVVLEASGSNAVLVGLGAVGGAILLWRPPGGVPGSTRALVVAWAVLPLILTMAVSVAKPILLGRYLIVAVPALALLAALAIDAIRVRALAYAFLAVTLGIGTYRVVEWYRAPSIEGWREAVEYVERNRVAADQVFVKPADDDEPYRFYAGENPSRARPTSRTVWMLLGAGAAAEALEEARSTPALQAYRVRVAYGRDDVFVLRGTVG
jgi:mannosyltransferase